MVINGKFKLTLRDLQKQMIERERLKEEAMREYEKEKANVEAVIQQMISEDMQMAQLTKSKQDQAKKDMIMSLMEKKANL